MRDHYEVLGVPRDASQADIKSAYRQLARIVHPDAAGEKTGLFALVSDAYQVLSDTARRRSYDAQLAAAEGPTQASAEAPSTWTDATGRTWSAEDIARMQADAADIDRRAAAAQQRRTAGPGAGGTAPADTPPRDPLPHFSLIASGALIAPLAGMLVLTSGFIEDLFSLHEGDRLLGGNSYYPGYFDRPSPGEWIAIVLLVVAPLWLLFIVSYAFKVRRNDGTCTLPDALAGIVVLFAGVAAYPVVFAPVGYAGLALTWVVLVVVWTYLPQVVRRARRSRSGSSPGHVETTRPESS